MTVTISGKIILASKKSGGPRFFSPSHLLCISQMGEGGGGGPMV